MGLGSFFGKLIGSGANEVAQGVADVVDRFVETAEEKKAAAVLLKKIEQEPDRWQAEINKIEAGHRTIFVAGWRPAVGWICAFALAWGWIVAPIMQFVWPTRPMPTIEVGQAISLVMAMLGMGTLRAYEKKNNLTS